MGGRDAGVIGLSNLPAHVECALRHRIGAVALDVAFATRAPWTILFGPSGSGKSTVLRILAGLVQPDAGAVSLLGQIVTQTAAGFALPAHGRPVRWCGQQAALFPRMTVRENLAFGADSALPGQVERALEHFDLRGFAGKLPGALSGGEQQRVAVVRAALAARGKVLLLDEPFTGLDGTMRERLIGQLRGWLEGSPVVSVTHDVGEAFLLQAEVVRLAGGRVAAQGPAGVVLAQERAGLLGLLG